MSTELEVEVTYLAARLPDLTGCKHREMRDVYFPADAAHAHLRIRQKDDSYEFTKKTQPDPDDAGTQNEENVILTKEEFDALAAGNGRELAKTRYYMPYNGYLAEIDVFKGDLKGLVVIEFEFKSKEERDAFVMPDFCLADVTQDEFIAGGVLAGKSLADMQPYLEPYHYKAL
jgi:CYTH domain-containing protein